MKMPKLISAILLATVAVTLYVARIAKRALAEEVEDV